MRGLTDQNSRALVLFGLLAVVCGTVRPAVALQPGVAALEEQAFKEAVALAGPSVVRIETVGGLERVGEWLTGTGPTTGVAVSEDGYVITSSFNFIGKPASILVTLSDGRRFPARQVSNDSARMLTLLKIDATGLPVPQVAPKGELRVGQWALALGRTYDPAVPSISVGIVSALNRVWGKAIQTDAKVSPVNYGGPLVDVQGRVMGILVPLSPDDATVAAGVEWYDSGIGFAVPLEDVFAVLDRLKAGEELKPGLMGLTFKLSDSLSGALLIDGVRYGSPGERAGLKAGDLIVAVDGRDVVRYAEIRQLLGAKYAGETVRIDVKRGEELISAELELVSELPAYEPAFLGILPARPPAESDEPAGVVVRYVYPDSPAAKAGLKPGDRIVRFKDEPADNAAALRAALGKLRPGDSGAVAYIRGEEESEAEVETASLPETVPGELSSSVIPPAEEAGDDAPKTGRISEPLPGYEQTFWMYVPEDYNPQHPYGLLVWLHPPGDAMEAEIFREWRLICDRRGLILLAPKAGNITGWTPNEAEFVKDAVAHVHERYQIDPERIILHGYAGSGAFAFGVAFKHRELFKGVAVVGAPLRVRPPETEPDFRLQLYMAAGQKDAALKDVQASVAALRKLKYPVVFTAVPGQKEGYPPSDVLDEIGRWADSLDRI